MRPPPIVGCWPGGYSQNTWCWRETRPGAVWLWPRWFCCGRQERACQAERDVVLTPDYLREEAQAYLGARDPRTPLASPLYADLHGLPPLLVQVGADEILLDDSTHVAERARASGVTVTLHIGEGMWHMWQTTAARAQFPEGEAALRQIGACVEQMSRHEESA